MFEQFVHLHFGEVFQVIAFLSVTFNVVDGSWYCTAAKSFTGSSSCIQDQPTSAIKITGFSPLRCGTQCDPTKTKCLAHQIDTEQQQCQLFEFSPRNWDVSKTGCQAFFCSADNSDAIDASVVCTFPFSYSGQLFYKCAVNDTLMPSRVWCLTSRRLVVRCSRSSYGYAVTSRTLNVTISSTVGSVSLKSVGGWLSVMSRIDATFPTAVSSAEYTNGFGNPDNNFWLGLEKVYQLTNSAVNGGQTFELRIELQGDDGLWRSIEYDYFYLGSSATSYTMTVSTTSTGDVFDSINNVHPSNNKPFAFSGTWCTNAYGPWWFTEYQRCSACRLFAPQMLWSRLGTNNIPQVVRMMVKAIT